MVSSVSGTSSDTTTTSSLKQTLGMDSDDFLKLFVAQLQYQDPLSPQDPSEMLGQLAQLSQVEQAYNMNTALTNLLAAQNNSANLSSVSFIGKTITAEGDALVFDGTNTTTGKFNFDDVVSSPVLTISNANGAVVRTVSMDSLSAGDNSYTWDGRDNSGNLLASGAYTFAVSGTTAGGVKQSATTFTSGRVDGVSIVDGSAVLNIGGASVAVADIISITS